MFFSSNRNYVLVIKHLTINTPGLILKKIIKLLRKISFNLIHRSEINMKNGYLVFNI